MILTLIKRLRGAASVALLAVALSIAGFGHRAPAQQDATIEAFLLSGFAMADLCGTAGSDQMLPGSCPACTLIGAALLPGTLCVMRDADLRLLAAIIAPRARQTVQSPYDHARAARGPPVA